jgi:Ca2+-binding RTX toxin-like protein
MPWTAISATTPWWARTDYLDGGLGNDTLDGGTGNDNLVGGIGNDSIVGGEGRDYLQGDSGDDLLLGGMGVDNINGGDGSDTLSYADWDAYSTLGTGVWMTLGMSHDDPWGNIDTVTNVENVIGTGTHDTVTGNTSANVIDGASGNDSLDGYSGDDYLIGAQGDDTLRGAEGADTLSGGDGNDVFQYWDVTTEGGDVITSFTSGQDVMVLMGTSSFSSGQLSSSDFHESTASYDGAGNGGVGNVGEAIIHDAAGYLWYDQDTSTTGNEYVIAQIQSGSIDYSDIWIDYYSGGGSTLPSVLRGYSTADTLTGTSESETIYGSGGADSLTGGAGNDVFYYYREDEGGDVIADFTSGEDTIYFHPNFNDMGTTTFQTYSGTYTGMELAMSGSFIVYDGDGNLWYDSDGHTSGTETLMATVNGDPVTAGDVFIDTQGAGDSLYGSSTADFIDGGVSNDTIIAYEGDDTLVGDGDNDYFMPGPGNDYIDDGYWQLGLDNDIISPAQYPGDVLSYQDWNSYGTASGVFVNVNSYSVTDPWGYTDVIDYGIEGAVGTGYADTLVGDADKNYLDGDAGNDSIYGMGDTDTLYGGAGNDTFLFMDSGEGGSSGDFIMDFASGSDVVEIGFTNTATFYSDPDAYMGNEGGSGEVVAVDADSYLWYDPDGSTTGGEVVLAYLNGGTLASTDIVYTGSAPIDWTSLSRDTDGSGYETDLSSDGFTLTTGDSVVATNEVLNGDGGDGMTTATTDAILGYGGDDDLWGGNLGGPDILFGGAGNDTLSGGSYNDILYGGTGNDEIAGHAGMDTLFGGSGTDAFTFYELGSTNADVIADFNSVEGDQISLFGTVFTGLATNAGVLSVTAFAATSNGVPATGQPWAYMVYDINNGQLFYDANGSDGFANATLVATLSTTAGGPASISASDIHIIMV